MIRQDTGWWEAVARAAAVHQPRAVLAAAWVGLGDETPLPPDWPVPEAPELRAVSAAVRGCPVAILGEVYEFLLAHEPSRRKRQGSHFTPLEVAAEGVAGALAPLVAANPGRPLRVCDPAVGAGVFLAAAARWLAEAGVSGQLYGVDRDPLAVAVAGRVLQQMPGEATVWLAVGDALTGPVRAGEPAGPPDGLDWTTVPGFGAGFDAVVGNPPFLGGSYISGQLGSGYRNSLVERIAGGRRGNADLAAYFLLRGYDLLRPGGRLGMVLTNTIQQGATRRIGLAHLVAQGAEVTGLAADRPWPGAASLHYTLLWLRRGEADRPVPGPLPDQPGSPAEAARPMGAPVTGWRVRAGSATRPLPRRLLANVGQAFHGTKIYGQGFLVPDAVAAAMRANDPASAEVLRPYLGGDDLYGTADRVPRRQVICFWDWPEARAKQYRAAYDWVRSRVLPERARLAGRNSIGDRRARLWWQFGSLAPGLYRALAGRETVLAKVLHSYTHAFCPVPANAIYSHALAVWADDDPGLLALLQSSLHRAWAARYSSTLGTVPRYTLAAAFETFPRPVMTPALAAAGTALEAHRQAVQRERGVGLTNLARQLGDPATRDADLLAWRALDEALEAAVLDAYGWPDLAARPVMHSGPVPWYGPPAAVLEQSLARLWELNEAAEPVRTGGGPDRSNG